ncbi:MAG: TRAP transporter fused permease subunit [Deltaproteobacteria bacterium]|nr:MAG: TRAP transporter fused permease subunit [Deltaproteobacteria bacterium]
MTKGAQRAIAIVLPIVAIAMAIYQLLYTQILIQSPDGHLITHLGFAFVVVFLSLMLKDPSRKRLCLIVVLLLLSLGITAYLMIELEEILEYRTSIPATSDLIVGTLLIFILLVAGWLVFGKTFTIVSLIAIAYLVLGRFFPPPFTVPAISYVRLLMWLSVELGTGKGVYGDILYLSAIYLFLFIFFGGVLYAFGGTRFIIGLGRWVGSKLRSGPAMVALFGSSLLGTITGSTVANITITGSYTIPMMKKSGYTPEQAGAIETVSSNGGQITPPIMGATAFLMAGFANIPYVQIVIAAIVPALLKFTCVFFYITLTAQKMKIRARVEPVKGRELLLDSPIFFLPLGVLVFLLVKGFTLPYVGFWSIVTLVGVGLITSALRKEARLGLRETLNKVVDGVRSASEIAIICGLLGVVVSAIVSSGLAVKLPLAIEDLSHGNLPIALFITMICSMLLGIGVPTPAAYMLVAVGAVPCLLRMGVPILAAHLFCFVSAVSSHITPPIAIGALVASKIAGANYWKTAWESVKAAFAKYLLPFFFIYAPVVLLRPDAGFVPSLLQVVAILAVIFSLQIAVSNYCFANLRLDETIAFIIASMFSLAAVFTRGELFFFIGLALFLVSITRQFMIGRKLKTQTGGAPI